MGKVQIDNQQLRNLCERGIALGNYRQVITLCLEWADAATEQALAERDTGGSLESRTTLELLAEIVTREGVGPCPIRSSYVGEWHETLVAVGDDHTAQIRFDDDTKDLIIPTAESDHVEER